MTRTQDSMMMDCEGIKTPHQLISDNDDDDGDVPQYYLNRFCVVVGLLLLLNIAVYLSSMLSNWRTECPRASPRVNDDFWYCFVDATASYKPVECGWRKCVYDNVCEARIAGFAEKQCTRFYPYGHDEQCPVEGSAVDDDQGLWCEYYGDPVQCGRMKCVYGNYCLAAGAGFAGNECTRIYSQ